MSLDRSLKTAGSLIRHRNVLTRAERVSRMIQDGKLKPDRGDGVLGLPKMVSRKAVVAKKKKKKGPESEGDDET